MSFSVNLLPQSEIQTLLKGYIEKFKNDYRQEDSYFYNASKKGCDSCNGQCEASCGGCSKGCGNSCWGVCQDEFMWCPK